MLRIVILTSASVTSIFNWWANGCLIFKKLHQTCDVIYSCVCSGRHSWWQKFMEKLQMHLLFIWIQNSGSSYSWHLRTTVLIILPCLLYLHMNPSKRFLVKSSKEVGKIPSSPLKISRQLWKQERPRVSEVWILSGQTRGYLCPANVCINNESFGIADTEELIASNDMIKHKIIFRQGYLEHTFYDVMSIGIADSDKNTIFFQNLYKVQIEET